MQHSLFSPQLSVSELTTRIQLTLENDPLLGKPLMVQGEVSNLSRSARGHIYLTLKDEGASIKCAIWASAAKKIAFQLEAGQALIVTGKLDIYAPSGSYTLIISHAEPIGIGALQLAFEQMKAQFDAEGLFSTAYKKEIPAYINRLGIVTSLTGSVLHDMLRVLRHKNPSVSILICPATVQGDNAPQSIAAAITKLNQPQYQIDTLIVARGGGSFEDLFCFSTEPVVRAIFASTVPVITGIGHEPDYGLADAVADYSAQTPTAAAERAVFDRESLLLYLEDTQALLQNRLEHQLQQAELAFDHVATQLLHALQQKVSETQSGLETRQERFVDQMNVLLDKQAYMLDEKMNILDSYSPLATLNRGYALVTRDAGQAVLSAQAVSIGETLTIQLYDGLITAKVTS
jgi:exodeoxyribonuclease VII large subunit